MACTRRLAKAGSIDGKILAIFKKIAKKCDFIEIFLAFLCGAYYN